MSTRALHQERWRRTTDNSARDVPVERRRRGRQRGRTRVPRGVDRCCTGDDGLDRAADAKTDDGSRGSGSRTRAGGWAAVLGTGVDTNNRIRGDLRVVLLDPILDCVVEILCVAWSTTTGWGSKGGCGCGGGAGALIRASRSGPSMVNVNDVDGCGRGGAEKEPRRNVLVMSKKNTNLKAFK